MPDLRLFVSEASSDGPLVKEVVSAYLDCLSMRVDRGDYSADALNNIRHELERFADHHPFAVGDCRQSDLEAWIAQNPSWQSPNTKKRIVSGIVACFRWALDEDLIAFCPYRRPKNVMNLASPSRRPCEPKEYVLLMRNGSRSLRRALFFLRRTGARTCEMRELTWASVFLDGDSPHICLTKHKTQKTGKPRKIGLDVGTVSFLRALQRQSSCDHVFTNCDGMPWLRHTFARHLRRTAKRIGLDNGTINRVSAYCLRHTYACDAVEAGLTTRQIADQLGHVRTDMVDRVYAAHTRQREEHLANVAREIAKKRKRKPST